MSTGTTESHETGIRGALAVLRRTLAPADHLALWMLTLDGAVVGSLTREGGSYRLDLFAGERDTGYVIADASDIRALEEVLSNRLGGTVRLQAVAA